MCASAWPHASVLFVCVCVCVCVCVAAHRAAPLTSRGNYSPLRLAIPSQPSTVDDVILRMEKVSVVAVQEVAWSQVDAVVRLTAAPCTRKMQSQRYIIPTSEVRRIRVLGSGTFGEIVLGEWLGTRVALKTQVRISHASHNPVPP